MQQWLKWAAVLQANTTQASMAAVTAYLQQQFKISPEQLLPTLQTFPEVLGWDVDADTLPKLDFLNSLGPSGQEVLDVMYDKDTGWLQVSINSPKYTANSSVTGQGIHQLDTLNNPWLWSNAGRTVDLPASAVLVRSHKSTSLSCTGAVVLLYQGLRSWQYRVAPKLQLLSDLLGSESAARALLVSCPAVLKPPVQSKLQPVLAALASTAGLNGVQLPQLLQQCPTVLTQPKEAVVSK